jgi:hypothetical protein
MPDLEAAFFTRRATLSHGSCPGLGPFFHAE